MDQDLTLNSIVFAKSFDEKAGSERRSTTRGVNTPDVMRIGREAYVDAKTKVAGTRYLMRFDYTEDVSGVLVTTSAYAVFVVNELSSSTALTSLKATIRAAVASTTPNLINQLLNSES